MHFFLHAAGQQTTVAPSTVISVAAHVVLCSLAVHRAGPRLADLLDPAANVVYYLPPPDRHPNSDPHIEHLSYVELGSGLTTQGKPRLEGTVPQRADESKLTRAGGNAGAEALSLAPTTSSDSRDSVYSILDVEESAVRTEGSAAPQYPPALMKSGVEGGVSIRFVVDTTGRPDPESVLIVAATDSAFAQSVKDAVPLMKFTPATVRGRHVRQAVQQSFQFRMVAPPPVNAVSTPRPAE